MKAIVQTRYGAPKVLELRDIYRPAVGNDQMLVRVRAASVHADVWHVTRGAKDAEGIKVRAERLGSNFERGAGSAAASEGGRRAR